MENIVKTAEKTGAFRTLVAAIEAADLVQTLASEGPFTVFAPTDAAFAKLPEGAVKGLLENQPKLKEVLTYHVVPGKIMAADVADMSSLKTVQGQSVTIRAGTNIRVNDAMITKTDIEAENGVIHVIDTVIMPR